MFYSGSPYSSFFTSGLLPSHTATSTVDSEDEFLYEVDFRRRGSLPDTTSSAASVEQFYKERSFLSLDLAGAGSLRYIYLFIPFHFIFSLEFCSVPSMQTLRSHPSLQNLPNQKPMPKYADALPALPMASARASSILLPNAIAGPSKPATIIDTDLKRQISTKTSVSTVSTNYRRTKRSDALAQLEGRTDAALASFKFGGIKEEPTSDFISLSDDENSSEDEWDAYSDEDADFVDLDIDFTSSHRHSYSTPCQHDDEEDILPSSPLLVHKYAYSSSSPLSPIRTPRRRSKTRSDSFRSLTRTETRARTKTMSMFPSNDSSRKYTSFMDLDHPTSELRPTLKRLSSLPTNTTGIPAPLLSSKAKTEEWRQWSSFIEISAVVAWNRLPVYCCACWARFWIPFCFCICNIYPFAQYTIFALSLLNPRYSIHHHSLILFLYSIHCFQFGSLLQCTPIIQSCSFTSLHLPANCIRPLFLQLLVYFLYLYWSRPPSSTLGSLDDSEFTTLLALYFPLHSRLSILLCIFASIHTCVFSCTTKNLGTQCLFAFLTLTSPVVVVFLQLIHPLYCCLFVQMKTPLGHFLDLLPLYLFAVHTPFHSFVILL